MNYSEVITNGLHKILPRRGKYTKRDINAVINHSLFSPYKGYTFTDREAAFIVKATATFHDTDWSKTVADYMKPLPKLRRDMGQ